MKILILLTVFLNAIPFAATADEWDVDLGQYRKVEERFFSNGKENKVNSPTYYYDHNDNMMARVLFNDNGEERFKTVYRYDDDNELVAYSSWSRTPGITQWSRSYSGIVEKQVDQDTIKYNKKESHYNRGFVLIETLIKDSTGKLVSREYFGTDGSYSYSEYDEHGAVRFARYNHEKSGGTRTETYEITYDEALNPVGVKTFEGQVLVREVQNSYDEENLLTQALLLDYERDTQDKRLYMYNPSKQLMEIVYVDRDGAESLTCYFEYDEQGRTKKRGERDKYSERYRLFVYH